MNQESIKAWVSILIDEKGRIIKGYRGDSIEIAETLTKCLAEVLVKAKESDVKIMDLVFCAASELLQEIENIENKDFSN